ncbi:Gfo/Idh/MocA family protein [Microbacterium xanthum]|uniref:Gfo/Idh/MocA family protein n=1 Tax=Microbacterium xanthum TaxID=3079794 RepID=UPI002AD4305D|nr:Gfo/Idh/MocA family oxidoreductase [Microbacterium sp. KSW-48]MDZ8171642.1 Gfo/Idh/MocA family oxidoreductase [Microbacterium sp. KSW-48]
MTTTRWAILGPGAISADFAVGLRASRFGELRAVGGRSRVRADAFAGQHQAAVSGTIAEVLERDDIDAVYIGAVHTAHAELARQALEAGKAVLCEKPATPSLAETAAVIDVARTVGRPFLEAFKTRFGPFAARVGDLVASGELGVVTSVDAAFGFAAGTREGRLFDSSLAGGALLDVGCYPVSLAVQIAASAGDVTSPVTVTDASAVMVGDVDGSIRGELRIGGVSATLQASIIEALPSSARIGLTDGEIVLPDAWGSRTESAREIIVRSRGEERRIEVPSVQPMAAEADALSLAIAEGRLEVPEMPWSHTLAVAQTLDVWGAAATDE